MSAVGYIRISMRDQSRYSLDYQEKSIRDYCDRNHLPLQALFTDNGESSYTFDRPDWKAVEAFIKQHKGNVHYLVVLDHDRFSRNLPEALLKIGQLETKFGIKVLATNEPVDIDTSDPAVFMQRAFKYLMANDELFRIRRRTSQGLRQAQESGRFVNYAPFGYKNKRDQNGKPIIIIEENEASIVRKIFFDYLLGKEFMVIYRESKQLGLTYTGNGAIRRILSNCTYAGLIRIAAFQKQPQRYVKGIHEPIVSEIDYWRVQELLGNIRTPKSYPGEKFPLRGFIKCWCGNSMTGSVTKGRTQYYGYYRCMKHQGKSIPVTLLHEKFDILLEALSFTTQQSKYLIKSVKIKLAEVLASRDKTLLVKQKELTGITEQINNLEERLFRNEIEADTYKRWFKKFSIQHAQILAEVQQLNVNQHNRWVELEHTIHWLSKLPNLFSLADLSQKHLLLGKWFQHGLSYQQGVFGTTLLSPLFAHNELKLKEKGLLLVKQPSQKIDENLISSGSGS